MSANQTSAHPSEFLSSDERQDLTGLRAASAQSRWMTARGIPHRLEGRRAIVSRYHVRLWLEGRCTHVGSGGINWAAVK